MAENRTVVRPSARLEALRWGLRALDAAAPPLAARLGERLFLTPPRHAAPRREREALRAGHPFEIPFQGSRLRGWRFGRDPKVLFVHGWGGRGSQLLALAEPLRRAGISFATFDAPAHGSSAGRTASVPLFAEALTAAAARLGGIRAIVAHSMGGAATAVAIRNGLVLDAAVLIGTPRNPARFFGDFATALSLRPSLATAVRQRLEARLGMRIDDFDITRFAPADPLPLLVIHDAHDKEVPWESADAIARQWPGARLVTTTGLGHRRVLHAPDVVKQVGEFLVERLHAGATVCSTGCGRQAGNCEAGGRRLCLSCALEAQLFVPALRFAGVA